MKSHHGLRMSVFCSLLLLSVALSAAAASYTLKVDSPSYTRVSISVAPPDTNGKADGLTPFVRNYAPGTEVTLTAPSRHQNKRFIGWKKDGIFIASEASVTMKMDKARTLSAQYWVSTDRLKWIYYQAANDDSYESPALGADGTIYVGNGLLTALRPNGTVKWRSDYRILGAPVVGPSGKIYASAAFPYGLLAFDSSGALLWSYPVPSVVWGTPVLGQDGAIYFGTAESGFFAIHPSGKLKWSFKTGTSSFDTNAPVNLAVASNGRVYVAHHDGVLYALGPDGKLRWKFAHKPDPPFMTEPAIGEDGTIYFCASSRDTFQNYLYALTPTGTQKWMFCPSKSGTLGSRFTVGQPVIGLNGVIFAAGSGCPDDFWALNPDGTLLWAISNALYAAHGPAVGSNGYLYFGDGDKNLKAYDQNGTFKWQYPLQDWRMSPPCIAADGTLYINTSKGFLWAIKTEARGLANSAWPRFHRNNQNTGQAE